MDGNIWDNVITQLKKLYNIDLVIFGYFNVEKPHIIALTCISTSYFEFTHIKMTDI